MRRKNKKYSNKALISEVKSLAHREKLQKLQRNWENLLMVGKKHYRWTDFEYLVKKWQTVVKNDLDKDRLGVFGPCFFIIRKQD